MRELPKTPDEWRDLLECAIEHGNHAWGDLRRRGLVHESEPPCFPPSVLDPVGSASYHLAAMFSYVQRVYEGIVALFPEEEDVTWDE